MLTMLRRAPWLFQLLTKSACQDSIAGVQSGPDAAPKDVSEFRQAHRAVPGPEENWNHSGNRSIELVCSIEHLLRGCCADESNRSGLRGSEG